MARLALSTISEPTHSAHWYKINRDEMVASAPQSIQALHSEHLYMLNLLNSLDEQVGFIAAGEDADFNLLFDIVDYMQNFPNRFHHPTEDLICQRMVLRDSDVLPEVEALQGEHRDLDKRISRLGDALRDLHILPAVSKRERVGQLCADYTARMRQHINAEEGSVLPRALEVLCEEDWLTIDQSSTPANDSAFDSPLDSNTLTDTYAVLQCFIKGHAEKLVNHALLADFFRSRSLLEFTEGLGASLNYGRDAYRQGVREGLSAYWAGCKSWMPGSAEYRAQGLQNPVRLSWQGFLRGMSATEKPNIESLGTMKRAVTMYGALMGRGGNAVDTPPEDEGDDVAMILEGMQFLEDVGKLLRQQ